MYFFGQLWPYYRKTRMFLKDYPLSNPSSYIKELCLQDPNSTKIIYYDFWHIKERCEIDPQI